FAGTAVLKLAIFDAKSLRTSLECCNCSSLFRISGRKTAAHFCWKCFSLLPHCPTQNRFALLLEMLCLPVTTTAKPASCSRVSFRETYHIRHARHEDRKAGFVCREMVEQDRMVRARPDADGYRRASF